jgi:hypothetical protein
MVEGQLLFEPALLGVRDGDASEGGSLEKMGEAIRDLELFDADAPRHSGFLRWDHGGPGGSGVMYGVKYRALCSLAQPVR